MRSIIHSGQRCLIRPIEAVETHPLRAAVLRPGSPPEDSVYPDDEASTTCHLGAWLDHRLIGIASFYLEPAPPSAALVTKDAWRLRGMAVAPDCQKQGIGRCLLDKGLQSVGQCGGRLLWCNARVSALQFYLAAGFSTVGEEFVIPDIGPHYVMVRFLD